MDYSIRRRKSHFLPRWIWNVYRGEVCVSPHFHSKQEARNWLNKEVK